MQQNFTIITTNLTSKDNFQNEFPQLHVCPPTSRPENAFHIQHLNSTDSSLQMTLEGFMVTSACPRTRKGSVAQSDSQWWCGGEGGGSLSHSREPFKGGMDPLLCWRTAAG